MHSVPRDVTLPSLDTCLELRGSVSNHKEGGEINPIGPRGRGPSEVFMTLVNTRKDGSPTNQYRLLWNPALCSFLEPKAACVEASCLDVWGMKHHLPKAGDLSLFFGRVPWGSGALRLAPAGAIASQGGARVPPGAVGPEGKWELGWSSRLQR